MDGTGLGGCVFARYSRSIMGLSTRFRTGTAMAKHTSTKQIRPITRRSWWRPCLVVEHANRSCGASCEERKVLVVAVTWGTAGVGSSGDCSKVLGGDSLLSSPSSGLWVTSTLLLVPSSRSVSRVKVIVLNSSLSTTSKGKIYQLGCLERLTRES